MTVQQLSVEMPIKTYLSVVCVEADQKKGTKSWKIKVI